MYDEKIVTKVCDTLVKAGSTFLGDKKEAYKKAIAKETNEQAKWTMEKILENATVLACQAPLEMMHAICETIKLLEEMLEKGRAMLISDVGCGALCCGAALESASMNVFVNTKLMQNRREAAKLDAQADTLLSEYLPRARRVADEVDRRLRKGG